MKRFFIRTLFVLTAFPVTLWAAPGIRPDIVETLPHDPGSFTQGLFFHDGRLYESSGLYGKSFLAVREPESGAILAETQLPRQYFAEGACLAGDKIYLLTWKEETAFILDPDSLETRGKFRYAGQGWGLAFDGARLIRSDGSHRLFFHDLSGAPLGSLEVKDGDRPVERLNEMEWLPEQGLLLANIWLSPLVAAISLESGQVRYWLDLAEIVPSGLGEEAVANGLALAPDGRSLWLTGKLWPVMYRAAWPPAVPSSQ